MLRLNEIKLPLAHHADALRSAVVERLGIDASELRELHIFKRSYDARNKDAILLIYQLDVQLPEAVEQHLLQTLGSGRIARSPDTQYRFVAQAPAEFPRQDQQRPIVV